MYLSLDWLKDYVKIPGSLSPSDLGLKLTLHTVEIDDVLKEADKYKDILIGLINEVKPHPNADKLRIAKVSVGGNEDLTIVCGAPNIKPGQKVPVAMVGAVLPSGMEIKAAKIRGEDSSGMLCAEDEIGLGSDHEGILILDSGAKIGMSLGEHLKLKDVVYEVDNKSITNRPDLWGHYGMAREIATFLGTKFNSLEYKKELAVKEEKININVEVKDSELCPRYMAVALDGVKIEASPKWMQKRLSAAGLRPINNIVDITNYVMLDLGQPLHAFDAGLIKDENEKHNIIVRKAKNDEEIVTLDGEKRKLTNDMLVIADSEKPVAVAGVMGGENSEISDTSTSIVIESANFDFISIRKTAQKLGLRTEASKRYEKSLDPNLCEMALRRTVELVLEICKDSQVVSKISDVKDFRLDQGPIELDLNWLQSYIGQEVKEDFVKKTLLALGFEVEKKEEDKFVVTIPTWRATKDISIKEDLVEEIARIVGYDNIKPQMPKVAMVAPKKDFQQELIKKIKTILSGSPAFSEVSNYSFVGVDQLTKMGVDYSTHLRIKNPIVKHHSMCRQSLVPNMLLNIKTNQARFDDIRLFEIGSVFLALDGSLDKDDTGNEKLPLEEKRLGIILAGSEKNDQFRLLKGVLENMADNFSKEVSFEFQENSFNWAEENVGAQVFVGENKIGTVNLIKGSICKKFGIKKQVAVAEINLSDLQKVVSEGFEKSFKEFEKFPPLVRDLAFVINKKVKYIDIRKEIENFHEFISGVELFDEYEGDQLDDDKKSLAFHVTYQTEKTLTGKEVDEIQEKLLEHLKERFDAVIRNF